jgi:hypothetical protein
MSLLNIICDTSPILNSENLPSCISGVSDLAAHTAARPVEFSDSSSRPIREDQQTRRNAVIHYDGHTAGAGRARRLYGEK